MHVTTARAPPGGRYRMESIEAVVTACHHFDGGFVHLPPGERHRMESIKAVDTACYHYDGLRKLRHRAAPRRAATHREHQGSRLPHSGAVGNALGASRQRTIHATTTTRGRTSWHRAAGRVAVHGEHRGRGYCLSSLRQGVVRHRTRVIMKGTGPHGDLAVRHGLNCAGRPHQHTPG